MEELLKNKLNAVIELKKYTEEIVELSLKTEYDKVNTMIEQRQKFIEDINTINEIIKKCGISETVETIDIKKEIRSTLKEIADMDNIIRKNISDELKNVKKYLNQPDKSQSISIKA